MDKIILHVTKHKKWEQAKSVGVYRGDTLDSEGFIHCFTPQQIINIANSMFYGALNIDVVIKVLSFEPDEDGKFKLPKEITIIRGI